MQISTAQLQQIIPSNPYVSQWTEALNNILPDYGIDTPQRVSGFIAQCAHESAGFTALSENLNYRKESRRRVFGKYFTSDALA